jgi:hypothetical protein
MMSATSFPPRAGEWKRRAMNLSRLVERIEKAMRPLASGRHGADHDYVRALYTYLRAASTGDALKRARRAVLYEILTPVVYGHPASPCTRAAGLDDEAEADRLPDSEAPTNIL